MLLPNLRTDVVIDPAGRVSDVSVTKKLRSLVRMGEMQNQPLQTSLKTSLNLPNGDPMRLNGHHPVQMDFHSGILCLKGATMRSISIVLTLVFVPTLFAQSSSYHITHTYTLGGDGRWDYVVPDPPNHRVFIARQNRVTVVDEDTGKLLGKVAGIDGA